MNEKEFIEETKKLGIELTSEQLQKLKDFYQILMQENKKINLTRIIEEKEVYLKHFYDSLTLVKTINLTEILTLCDVGTGAGFPGIVLKIVFPNLKITLLDALQKRVLYLNRVITQLELKDIEAFHIRSEDYAKQGTKQFDVVTARAVANLTKLAEICMPLVAYNGYFIPMKGKLEEELDEAQKTIEKCGGKIEKITRFHLPIEESERTIVKIRVKKKTPQVSKNKSTKKYS